MIRSRPVPGLLPVLAAVLAWGALGCDALLPAAKCSTAEDCAQGRTCVDGACAATNGNDSGVLAAASSGEASSAARDSSRGVSSSALGSGSMAGSSSSVPASSAVSSSSSSGGSSSTSAMGTSAVLSSSAGATSSPWTSSSLGAVDVSSSAMVVASSASAGPPSSSAFPGPSSMMASPSSMGASSSTAAPSSSTMGGASSGPLFRVLTGDAVLQGAELDVPVDNTLALDRSLLVFGEEVDATEPGCVAVTARLLGGVASKQVHFERLLSGCPAPPPTVALHWYVVEFWTGVQVKAGMQVFPASGSNNSPSVQLGGSTSQPRLVLLTNSAEGATMGAGDFFAVASAGNPSNLRLERFSSATGLANVDWQVLTINGGSNARYTTNMSSQTLTAQVSLPLTGGTSSRSLYTVGYTAAAGTGGMGGMALSLRPSLGNNMELVRGLAGPALAVTVRLSELPAPLEVEQGQASMLPGENFVAVPLLSPVEDGHAFAMGLYRGHGGWTDHAADTNAGAAWATFTLLPPGQLVIRRGAALGNATFFYQVVRDH